MENKEQKNPIDEARRYVANAEENIARAVYDPETKSYLDSKYVNYPAAKGWHEVTESYHRKKSYFCKK